MITTHIYTHPDCLKHNPGPDVAYAPKRLQGVEAALRAIPGLEWASAGPASRKALLLVHTERHLAQVLAPVAPGECRVFASDTIAVAGTADALLASAGMALAATDDVAAGRVRSAFCLTSPGGHHAEAETAGGFCFINHIAVAAAHAQANLDLRRVAVVDIDAHHGNGTQSMFWNHADRLFISLHEDSGLSGFARETGSASNVLNIPVPYESDGEGYLRLFDALAAPKLEQFRPDMLFVSAGFDAHRDDPLGKLALVTDDYNKLGGRLAGLANRLCGGRLVAVMEGGYNLDVLGASVASFVIGMMRT